MAKRKPTFPELPCYACQHYTMLGDKIFGTRACMGVKSKKGKRFRKSDPKYKPPKWCPRRLSVKVCRIYRLADEEYALLEENRRQSLDVRGLDSYPLLAHRYDPVPRLEFSIGMSAKQFYQQAMEEPVSEIFQDVELEYGDVIEIDDGLKPYYFYYYNFSHLIPTWGLERTRKIP